MVGEGERDGAEEGMGARTTLLRHPYSSPLRSTDRATARSAGRSPRFALRGLKQFLLVFSFVRSA